MPAQTWAHTGGSSLRYDMAPNATRKKAAQRDRMDDPSGVRVGFQDEEMKNFL
jgi:hypothetical protein